MQRRRGSMANLYSMGFVFHWFHPLHPPPVLTMLVKQNCSIIPAPSLVWTFCHGGSKYRWPSRIQIYFKQFWWKVLATEFHVTQVPYKKRYTWTPDGHPTAMQRNPSGGKQSTSGSGWACPRGRCPYLLNIHRCRDWAAGEGGCLWQMQPRRAVNSSQGHWFCWSSSPHSIAVKDTGDDNNFCSGRAPKLAETSRCIFYTKRRNQSYKWNSK